MTLPRRTFLNLAAGTAALPIASPVAVFGQGTITAPGAVRIVERTQYYVWPPRSSRYGARRPPCASRSDFRPVKYSSSILAVTAASRMSPGNALSPTWPHAMRTSRRAPQARNSKAFACR
jgi:hypothetical protein